MKRNSIKLIDEQIRRFICDGVLVLDSDLDPDINQQIFDKIQWNNTREFNMGNNVLPRIAELQHVLDAPVIHGALQSVLGDDYILHPHRYMHASEPLDGEGRHMVLKGDEHGPPMGEGSTANSAWHQDGQCPLGRSRYHVPRLAMIIYFPQDTPTERGPTRLIPGTQLHACLNARDYPFAFVADNIKAGTCLLIAFDIAHAALSNLTEMSRYMFKFVFMRTQNPVAPSWDGDDSKWQPPDTFLGRFDHGKAWSFIWDWMRGARRTSTNRPATSDDVQRWIGHINGPDQQARLEAIYELADMGADAIGPLQESLLQYAGQGREVPVPYHRDAAGAFVPKGDPYERRWNDIACVPQDEAYALGAMGEVAVGPLMALLKHDDPWIKINAAFALGEIGSPAGPSMADLAELLAHELHQVARVSLDAMAFIGTNTRVALPAIRQLLTVHNPRWQEPSQRWGWTGENQARFNALCALLNSDVPVDELEDLLITTLDDDTGYVPALALEILTRECGSKNREGLRHALDYLKLHRWDDTLANERRVY